MADVQRSTTTSITRTARGSRLRALAGPRCARRGRAALWYGDFFEVGVTSRASRTSFRSSLAEGLPPDFGRYREWGKALLDTIVMSVGGTAIAVVLSFPLGFLAARNTTPTPAGLPRGCAAC